MPTDVFPLTAQDPHLREVQEAERVRDWREGFEAMGRDSDTNSVEYMLPVAREVLKLAAYTSSP